VVYGLVVHDLDAEYIVYILLCGWAYGGFDMLGKIDKENEGESG